ncbi:sensor histidine kinase [Saccharopolyspora mangrovi]|uniref:histidine kinase n=1 Tax=Saccharopolyspora mangrovi TaxID=3082379 RepID=A0ABU6ACK4_9PSEU|nr:nitrate- and nitrite sensing domain-containing protein [Saccharopolyspora sp. S2-29]MEB3369291.1 nitrate- and nitrite sensing domain-containing protein [Saccharopolyspora sp. S2-29]
MSAAAQETGMLNNDPATAAGAADPAAARTKKWWLRNWRLRYKMAAVLLVPTLAALGVGGVRIYDGLNSQSQMQTIVDQVELAQQTSNLTHELQRERDFAIVLTTANGGSAGSDYAAQGQRVDAAVQQVLAFEPQIAGFTPEVRFAYQSAEHRIGSLGALRGTVNSGFTSPQTMIAYNSVIDTLLTINNQVANSAANTATAQTARAADALGQAKEQLARQRSVLLSASLRNQFLTGQPDQMRAADARYEAAYGEFEAAATQEQRALFAERVAGAAIDRTEQLEQSSLIAYDNDQQNQNLGVSPADWGQQSGQRTDLVREVESDVLDDLHSDATALADSATWTLIRDSALVALLLIVAFGVATFIARSMLRPLRTLRYSALEIAQQSLPDAINRVTENPGASHQTTVPTVPVYTDEEIGQVARTFDAVHQQALRLAVEQAMLRNNVNDLFVNLARRSQTLVQRQLALIDRLEQDEQDPDQLSSLFELDHLATRMRRNNENLLILGGTDLTRRTMRPVPLNEVLGAAVSEVEQYARVAVVDAPELALQGRVVNDFVHLVAELLENATVFSNPDTEVTVRTAYRRQQLVIEIRDRGVGIDAGEIDEINERLVRPPDIDVAVSRRMGLFVVGQLARRHNIEVELGNNEGLEGGVTATVRLSGELVVQLTPDGPVPMPDMPRTVQPEERGSLTETGTQLGLAAAFGGRAAAGSNGQQPGLDAPTTRAELPSLSGSEPPTSFTSMNQAAMDSEISMPGIASFNGQGHAGEPDDDAELPAQYSFTTSSGDSFGATSVPQWEDDGRAPHDDEVGAEAWPDIDPGFDGQCGAPSETSSTDLFHSPFEAEKTKNFAPSQPLGSEDSRNGFSGGGLNGSESDSGSLNGNGLNGSGIGAAFGGGYEGAPGNGSRPESASESWESENASLRGTSGPEHPGSDGGSTAYADDEPRESWDMDDAPTQRLPIYEAVLSQWFRESDVEDSTPAAADPKPAEPEGAESSTQSSSEPEPVVDEVPRTTTPEPGWGQADVGWKAAEALLQTHEVQETTAAGLPKRVPKTNLVPGSAAPRSPQTPRRKPAAPRSADAVRGRMANFQQGVHRGRHAKSEPVSTELPRSNPSRPEEQE